MSKLNKQFIFNNVKFSYKHAHPFELSIPYLELGIDKPILITGGNASGKTTLLKLCSGLLKPTDGNIFFGSEPVFPILKRNANLVFVHQNPYIFKGTVYTNLITAITLSNHDKNRRTYLIEKTIEMFKLEYILHKKHFELTAGERQKTALARAWAIEPDAMLLDEPSTALDADVRALLVQAINTAVSSGTAIMIASHDNELKNNISGIAIALCNGHLQSFSDKGA